MPIDYKRYPENWHEFSRKIRFERAENKCEKCGVPNHSIGFRRDGQFEFWELDEQTSNDSMTIRGENGYAESKQMLEWIVAVESNYFDNDVPRPTIIVLTVAHLDNYGDICECEKETGKKCAIDSHVLALCQKCHLSKHIENARNTRIRKNDAKRLLLKDV